MERKKVVNLKIKGLELGGRSSAQLEGLVLEGAWVIDTQ